MEPVIFLLVLISSGAYLLKTFAGHNAQKEISARDEIENINKLCFDFSSRLAEEQGRNKEMEKAFESTITLYDFTREINKSFLPDEIRELFKNALNEHIRYEDCRFVSGDTEALGLSAYAGFDLDLGGLRKEKVFIKGVGDKDKYSCGILISQLVLGLRRAYLYQEIQRLAITDSLTGVFSRRYVFERMEEELSRSEKLSLEFSVLMVDIDKFKDINDTYGHLVGDWILCESAAVMKGNLRQIDLLGRYGGEEFLVLLTETPQDKAKNVAERIRLSINSHSFKAYDEKLKVTASIGISSFPADGRSAGGLVDKADKALYKAKEKGRDMVCAFRE